MLFTAGVKKLNMGDFGELYYMQETGFFVIC